MRVDMVELEDGQLVHVLEEIYGIRYSGDRFVLGVILGHSDISETDICLVECELADAGTEIFLVMPGEPREIELSLKAFDKMVAVVTAYRNGELEGVAYEISAPVT